MSQKTGNKLDSAMYINVEDDSDIELLRIEQVKSSQVSVDVRICFTKTN